MKVMVMLGENIGLLLVVAVHNCNIEEDRAHANDLPSVKNKVS